MQNKLTKLIIFIGLATLAINPFFAYAQNTATTATNSTSNVNNPSPTDLPVYNASVDKSIADYLCTPQGKGTDLFDCVDRLYRFGVSAGSIAIVFFIVYAGYLYITSGEAGKTSAKKTLLSAFTGLAIMLTSYVLLYFINPSLVVIKPIQPPIFTAGDLPSCEEVGFGEKCLIPGGTQSTGDESQSVGFGEKITCSSSDLVSAKGLGLPTKQADEKICKAFGERLLGLKSSLTGINWYITDTIGTGHLSKCHKSGTAESGSCADLGITEKSPTNWSRVCKALLSIGDLQPVNEASKDATDCPKYGTYATTTGQHIHVNWKKTTSSGGGGGSSSSGGSRPNCIPVSGVPGVCGNPTSGFYKDGDFPSAKPELLTAYNKLKKAYPSIRVAQVYRSPQYSAYLRSIWEADALANHGWTDAEVRSHGQYCQAKGIQYVTAADAKNPKVKQWVSQNSGHISIGSPTTCLSDHGQGIAFDIDGYKATPAFETAAKNAGLCHDVPVFKTRGITSKEDVRHFALINGPGVKCVNYW